MLIEIDISHFLIDISLIQMTEIEYHFRYIMIYLRMNARESPNNFLLDFTSKSNSVVVYVGKIDIFAFCYKIKLFDKGLRPHLHLPPPYSCTRTVVPMMYKSYRCREKVSLEVKTLPRIY